MNPKIEQHLEIAYDGLLSYCSDKLRDWPTSQKFLGLDDLALYQGVSGSALSLFSASRILDNSNGVSIGRELLSLSFNHSSLGINKQGFFEGRLGIGVAYINCMHSIGESTDDLVNELLADIESEQFTSPANHDLMNGIGGRINCLSQLYFVSKSDHILKLVLDDCKFLLSEAMTVHRGITWPLGFPLVSAPMLGLAHGVSGTIYALAKASRILDEETKSALEEVQLAAARYERMFFSKNELNWPDFRVPWAIESSLKVSLKGKGMVVNGRTQAFLKKYSKWRASARDQFMFGWCHGGPGIGHARLQMRKSGIVSDDIDNDIEAVYQKSNLLQKKGFPDMGFCLCHGILSIASFLIEHYSHFTRPDSLELAEQSVLAAFDRIETTSVDSKDKFSLMLGLGGYVCVACQLTHPDRSSTLLDFFCQEISNSYQERPIATTTSFQSKWLEYSVNKRQRQPFLHAIELLRNDSKLEPTVEDNYWQLLVKEANYLDSVRLELMANQFSVFDRFTRILVAQEINKVDLGLFTVRRNDTARTLATKFDWPKLFREGVTCIKSSTIFLVWDGLRVVVKFMNKTEQEIYNLCEKPIRLDTLAKHFGHQSISSVLRNGLVIFCDDELK